MAALDRDGRVFRTATASGRRVRVHRGMASLRERYLVVVPDTDLALLADVLSGVVSLPTHGYQAAT
jgi:hypothetical protein